MPQKNPVGDERFYEIDFIFSFTLIDKRGDFQYNSFRGIQLAVDVRKNRVFSKTVCFTL